MGMLDLYTPKQIEVLHAAVNDNWRFLINHGAKRSGKTVIDNDLFLMELIRVRKLADEQHVKEPMYILAGYSSKTIQNNILQELSNKYGFEFQFDKHNSFRLFGVKIVQTFHGSILGLGAIRGMTSYGAYVNEASLANQEVFEEIKDRCSEPGSRIICDTNPDNPQHWLKKDYIDNKDPEAEVESFHFTIDDNTFLDPDYVKQQKAGTPSGMFYDRSILGLWVSGEGAVYADFDERTMLRDHIDTPPNATIYCGVDWGYEHKGSIVVCADDQQGNTYLLEDITFQYKEIDFWVDIAKSIQKRYHNPRMPFFADSARPEHVARFVREDINCYNANKSILSGIEEVSMPIKTGHFFVSKDNCKGFLSEIYEYIWDEKTGLPVKENDDVMDALRYAIYSQHHKTVHAHAASFHF